jgi:hypothetical protein
MTDTIKVTRTSAGYTFVKVARREGGVKLSATYRAAMSDVTGLPDVAGAHQRAIEAIDQQWREITGEAG